MKTVSENKKSKIPWSSRWSLVKTLLFQGVLPANWASFSEIYQVGDEVLVSKPSTQNFGDRHERRKIWKESIEEQHQKNWSYQDEIKLWHEALRLVWFEKAPNQKLKDYAQYYWQLQPAEVRKKSWVDWKAFGYSDQPHTPQAVDWSALSDLEKNWLLGWVIAVTPEDAPALMDDFKLNPSLKINKNISTIEWATLFHQTNLVTHILETSSEEIKTTSNLNELLLQAYTQIRLNKFSFNLKWIIPSPNNLNLTYHAVWWGARNILKELCLRGQASAENQISVNDNVILKHALDMMDMETVEILLDFDPIVLSPISNLSYSPIQTLIDLTESANSPVATPSYQKKMLSYFNKMLSALEKPSNQNRKFPTDSDKELFWILFKIIENQKDPILMEALIHHAHQYPKYAKWKTYALNQEENNPSFNALKQRKYITLFDLCLDKNRDEYMSVLSKAHFYKLNKSELFEIVLCTPKALSSWFETMTAQEIKNLMNEANPKPLKENMYLDCQDHSPRPRWHKNEDIWECMLSSRNPGVAIDAFCNEKTLKAMITPQIWSFLYGYAFSFEAKESILAVNALLKLKEEMNWTDVPYSSGLLNILNKDSRSFKNIEQLALENKMPWHHPLNPQGDTLVHKIIQEKDVYLFKLLLQQNVSFEVPNQEGLTPLSLSLETASDFHAQITNHLKETMQNHLNLALDSKASSTLKNQRL